ncbi:hypothetical protein [Streptomyces sp. NPDC101206]|uniref:hypothetical protein n=1 Tax=Streptomyces sp. NPDC101206 TaxID=3366128 RepID=UPI0037FCBE50
MSRTAGACVLAVAVAVAAGSATGVDAEALRPLCAAAATDLDLTPAERRRLAGLPAGAARSGTRPSTASGPARRRRPRGPASACPAPNWGCWKPVRVLHAPHRGRTTAWTVQDAAVAEGVAVAPARPTHPPETCCAPTPPQRKAVQP